MRRYWVLALAALLPVTPAAGQQFGASAAVSDDEVLIGEPLRDDGPSTVYVFSQAGDDWVRTDSLTSPEGGEESDYFGRFLALDEEGGTLFVGGTTFEESTGTVWQFERSGDGWEFVGHLRPEDVQQGDSYGRTGVLVDDLLFVGSMGHDEQRGAVWVFRRGADGAWSREAKLGPAEAQPGEFFGASLAYDGERLLVGAATPSQQNRGAVYIFGRDDSGAWTQEHRIALGEQEGTPGMAFGNAVGWLDGMALVGAPGADQGRGTVYTYTLNEATGGWEQGENLAAWDREQGAGFGAALDTREGALWVGAPGADGSGRVYRFQYDAENDVFGDVEKLAGLDQDVGDGFGSLVAVNGRLAVIGQSGDDFGLGSAIVMSRLEDDWRAAAKLLGPEPEGLAPITGDEVPCDGGTADQFDCDQVDILSFLPVRDIGGGRGAETNDVWGWTDPGSGREFALVGRTDGTAFIEITDPGSPVYLGNLPKTPGSRGNSWRDVKVYENHAYVVADGAGDHGMQVFDLTQLLDVPDPPVEFEPDAHYEAFASAHNIVINEETGFAYAVGANSGGHTCGGGLHMIDIRDPENPTFAGCFQDTRTGRAGTGYSHDAMCIVYEGPDTEHQGKEVCFGSNETALAISDVSDKDNPRPISVADYPNVGYSHQGWITEDHRYFYMNDEGDETNAVQAGQPMPGTRTLIWDVTDLDDPIMVKEHFGTEFTIDHNLYIKDDLMYQSNYVSGLRILDVSDRENPREVGFLDTVPWSQEVTFDGSWSNYPYFESGTIVVSSGREGVFFLKHTPRTVVP